MSECPKCGASVIASRFAAFEQYACMSFKDADGFQQTLECAYNVGVKESAARVELLEKALDSMAMAFANHQRMYDACPAGGILDRAKEHKAWHLAVAKGENPVAAIDAARGTE